MTNHTTAQEIWPDETVFIICGGPSLRGFDFNRLAGKKVIAINSSGLAYPNADVLFFGDARWWVWNEREVKKTFKGHIFTVSETSDPRVFSLNKRRPPPYLSTDPSECIMQHTSTTAAINLAYHFGSRRIVLMGADMQAAKDGQTHHHAPHPIPQKLGCWNQQMRELREVAAALKQQRVKIINTSLDSLIDFWPKKPIEELL